MKNECGWIPANTEQLECRDIITDTFKNVDQALHGLLKSATYGILMRSIEESDYNDFSIEVYDGHDFYRQTIIYKGVERAVIKATYGMPIVFTLDFIKS